MRHVVALALFTLGASAVVPDRYHVAPESRLWIDGTATTGAWTCAADGVAGQGAVSDQAQTAWLTVPVRALDCGSGLMNRDLYGALRADDHPVIAFDLAAATSAPEPRPGAWLAVEARGTLQLAGAARPVTVHARGRRRADGRVELQGRHALRMSDFGVRPPSHVGGLIRAHDAIEVRFEIVAVAH